MCIRDSHPISYMSNNVAWHHKVPSAAQLQQAINELSAAELQQAIDELSATAPTPNGGSRA